MKNHLTASDLEEHIIGELEIRFSGMPACEEDSEPVSKSSQKTKLLSADEIAKEFDVSDEVAAKLAGYQHDLLVGFQNAARAMTNQSERYLQVKKYVGDKKYDSSMLEQYAYGNTTMNHLNPGRHAVQAFLGVLLSTILLTAAVVVSRSHWHGFTIDTTGGWILAVIWAGFTLLAAFAIPKGYRTRKFLVSMTSSN